MSVSESISAGMRRTNEYFETEFGAKRNVAALDQVYTKNSRILPPGAPMVSGREDIKKFWAGAIEALGVTAVKLHTVDAEAAGDGVVEIGRAELTTPAGKAEVKYVVYWKQEDGLWKWNVDIWNPNQ